MNAKITKMLSMETLKKMKPKDLAKLKEKTAKFLEKAGWNPGCKLLIDVPFELICIPEYQEERVLKTEKSNEVTKLIAAWDDNKAVPVMISIRTDGPYAGLLFIVDGYHRARACEIMNDSGKRPCTGVESQIKEMAHNNESLVFADQFGLSTRVTELVKYKALLACSDTDDVNVKSAWNINDVLNKYHMVEALTSGKNDKYCKLGVGQAMRISKDEIIRNREGKFDWIIEILKTSGYAKQHRGLSSDMLQVMGSIYDALYDGKFGTLTPNDVKQKLIAKIKKTNWAGLETIGSYIYEENATTARATDRRSRVKAAIACFICEDFGLTNYVLRKPSFDFINDGVEA